jgi:HAD superfamily hydrolase (TIGR01509 family)
MEAATRFFSPRVPLSLGEIFERWEVMGHQQGFPRTVVEEKAFFVQFWDDLADELELSAAIRSDLHQFDYTTCLTVYPDVLPMLKAARAANLRIGVLSNFALASLEESLITTGLAMWIDVACAATVIGSRKPEAASYATAAARLDVAPAECLFFDDELPCVAGALACGMHAYHVDRTLSGHDLGAGKVADLSALPILLSA